MLGAKTEDLAIEPGKHTQSRPIPALVKPTTCRGQNMFSGQFVNDPYRFNQQLKEIGGTRPVKWIRQMLDVS
ncbi:hypothetical protein [Thermogutta sp.]|uniref:hypothetical protein n=1 Tax=Thermogutta sp. TaxID=1962930 RepID=UPI00321FBA42